MDSYIQSLCRFQKSMLKVPPTSLPCTKKSPPKGDFFLEQGSDGGGTFFLLLWNLHEIWI